MIFLKNVRSISWSALRWHLAFYLVALLSLFVVLRFFVHEHLLSADFSNQEFLVNFDSTLVSLFWISALICLSFSFIFVRIFFSPLDILIGKAKSIKKGQYKHKKKREIKESRGEWYLLDLNLNKISKDLKKKKDTIEKERSELEAIITAANDPVLAVDAQLNIRYYNAPMALFFDQKEEGQWGKPVQEVIRNPKIVTAFQRAVSEQKSQTLQTQQELTKDSTLHYYNISISPFVDAGKTESSGAVALFHDITELKKIEKVRVDFVANASHEFKTPLTSIQGYFDFIRQSSQEPQLQEAFQVVDKNLQRLNRLVTDLLQLTKIEAAEPVASEWVSVTVLTQQVLDELRGAIEDKKHKISTKIDVQDVIAHRDLMEHVLVNLIENAIKYCPPQSEIRIHWGETESAHFLSVKDNGPGIESYHQSRIFERFYRVRDEKNQSVKGTGLGLSIVRHAMQKMSGVVDVKSAPGMGSEFICYFPKASD